VVFTKAKHRKHNDLKKGLRFIPKNQGGWQGHQAEFYTNSLYLPLNGYVSHSKPL
tara:strand:- start:146 stop:310 length:165 start_codon:yes stop_codon:yes gene_type:complete